MAEIIRKIQSDEPKAFTFEDLANIEHPEQIMEKLEPFNRLMMQYNCAIMEIETKLHVLNTEFSLDHNRNPIEDIHSRIKKPFSIAEKLKRKGYPFTLESIETNLLDIAGVRVVCSFPEDIYAVRDMLLAQDDVHLLEEKDYIKAPKDNGYRSLHLIVETPIFLSQGKKMMTVEIQIRTIAMDCWATLEHKMKYKKDIKNPESISARLKHCADISFELDSQMQTLRREIDADNPEKQYL